MVRILIAAILGVIVHYGYNAFAWTAAPWHNMTMNRIDQEREALENLEPHLPNDGVYVFPAPQHSADMSAEERSTAWSEWQDFHEQGPIGMIFYRSAGAPAMLPTTFAVGFAFSLVASLLASTAVFISRGSMPSYWGGVLIVTLLGIFVAINGPLMGWNWLWMPTDHSLAMVLDHVLGWLLVGLVSSAIIKAPARGSQSSPTG